MENSNSNLKKRLILVSDLWGKEKSDWVTFYTNILKNQFEIQYYDCCDLGEIDTANYSQENLHHQFINGGIDKAVENLLKKESEPVTILGFSIGGLIAWKASLLGLKIQNFYAISSTRLRNETQKPMRNIQLFYGENDEYKPNDNWFNHFGITENFFKNEAHECYTKKEIAEVLCKMILDRN